MANHSAHNAAVLSDRDGKPGLDTRYRTWIEKKDSKRGLVLMSGLGALGVGSMWVGRRPEHIDDPGYGYAEAEEVDYEALTAPFLGFQIENGALSLAVRNMSPGIHYNIPRETALQIKGWVDKFLTEIPA